MFEEVGKILKDIFSDDLEENEPMKKHTSMRVGGPCQFFYTAKKSDDLKKIIKIAIENKLPYIVIGNGTNIIFADAGFSGLVVKNETSNLVFEKDEAVVDSGMSLARLIRKLAEGGMGGLEFLAGIPGTIGGAVYGNAGAYGRNIGDIIRGVLILDIDGKVIQISNKEMKFKYRSSYLKELSKVHDRFRLPIILSVRLKIIPKSKEAIIRVVDHYQRIRVKKYPSKPSVGSFFKNIIVTNQMGLSKDEKIMIKDGKIPAGFLIERAGCKGLKINGAEVSREHANFIINTKRAKAIDIKKLSEKVKEKVKDEFGVELEEELEFIGDFSKKPKGFLANIFK